MSGEDEDYIENKRSDRVYVSREFSTTNSERPARYISRVLDDGERIHLDVVEGEWVLRTSSSGKMQIKLFVTADDHKVRTLHLQRFFVAGDGSRPTRLANFTLTGEQIERLLEVAALAAHGDFPGPDKVRLDAQALEHFDIDRAGVRSLLLKHQDLLAELVKTEITDRDVIAVAYRKAQLSRFERLLRDPEYFEDQKQGRGKERLWQDFFEENRWIFGYGLFQIATSGLDGLKLEQIVAGAFVGGKGKRTDALMKTNGRIASLCFVEVKTHDTPLLRQGANPYRSGAWAISRHLAGAVAQIQRTVDLAEAQIRRKLTVCDKQGDSTGEVAYLCRPRCVLVCGDLEEFVSGAGVNEEKFISFELYRRQLLAPEIVTFDELLQRAKLIVEAGASG
jgi:hypothetical protein